MAGAPELIFVGIDVSKATLEVALNDRDKTQTFSNDEPGLKSLLAMLTEMRERVGVVLLEAPVGWSSRRRRCCARMVWPSW